MVQAAQVEIQGRQLTLSNLEKVLYPAVGFTKRQVINYYVRVAPYLLPHLAGRPLTLKRYPDGVEGEYFYEKNAPMHRPEWVHTAPVWSRHNRRNINFVLADDLPTLVWLANLASLELHTSLSLAKKIDQPAMMVFDLDPGPPATIVQCARVGLWLREIFEHFGLQSFPKTSGSKGLQVYVPLNTSVTYDDTKTFAQALARLLEQQHPEHVVAEMKKEIRGGKVFIDWSQNDEHKTTVCVYSLRAREKPTVSTPLTWEEVEQTWKSRKPSAFETADVLKRCEKYGDLFAPVLQLQQALPHAPGVRASVREDWIDVAAAAEPKQPQARTSRTKTKTKTKSKQQSRRK